MCEENKGCRPKLGWKPGRTHGEIPSGGPRPEALSEVPELLPQPVP